MVVCLCAQALLGSDGLALRTGQDADGEFRRDSVERDEKRLAELGKRTVEMYAIAHIFSEKLEVGSQPGPDISLHTAIWIHVLWGHDPLPSF